MNSPFLQFFLVPAIALQCFSTSLKAEDDGVEKGTLTIYFENDLFSGTDRYYTNGTKISYTTANLNKFEDDPFAATFVPVLSLVPYINAPKFQRNFAVSIGQNMYTPDNTETMELVEGDRPYAGWLYLGFGMIWKNASVRNALTLELGVVGPSSFAEETQRFVHEARGIGVPQGWDNQLENEFGVNLGYERMWRFPRREYRSGFAWELLPYVGATIGNVSTYANVGGEFRVGFNLPDDFGTPTLSATATTSTPVEETQAAERARFDFGMYVFARVEGRAVARNIFLDGNTFSDSHSVDKRPLVGDISAGISMNYHNTKITYAAVYRSKEFYGQEEAQVFGSVSVNMAF